MTNGILLTRHNQEIAQWSPDPFPRERVGSGHETRLDYARLCSRDPQLIPCPYAQLPVPVHVTSTRPLAHARVVRQDEGLDPSWRFRDEIASTDPLPAQAASGVWKQAHSTSPD